MPSLHAPIEAITVFADRARITRRGSIRLKAGEHLLQIPDLPMQLDETSVRATALGSDARIIGIEVTTCRVAASPGCSVEDLELQLQTAGDQDSLLADEAAAEDSKLAYLKSVGEVGGASMAKALGFGKTTLDGVVELIEYVGRELDAGHARRRQIGLQRRELARTIEGLTAQLEQARSAPAQQRRAVILTVVAGVDTLFELELVYGVGGVNWEPLYDIRLMDDRLTITYLARIGQQTGEDWPAVPLALSTARPTLSSTVPELEPWYVNVFHQPATRGHVAYAMAGAGSAAPAPWEEPLPFLHSDEVSATGEAASPQVTHRVARSIAIPSDGAQHKTTVAILDLVPQVDYLTIPKLAPEVFLRARFRNTSDMVLLAGDANVFHGDDFIGTSSLPLMAPQDDFEVQLGLDNRIQVERRQGERSIAKGFIGNNKRTVYSYRTTITNSLPSPARLTVHDQIPVARHEDIKIKLQDALPKPTDQSETGLLTWELNLKPLEKREIAFSFAVEHPRETQVAGLVE